MSAVRVYSFADRDWCGTHALALHCGPDFCGGAQMCWPLTSGRPKIPPCGPKHKSAKIVTDSPWAKEAVVSFKGNAKLSLHRGEDLRGGLPPMCPIRRVAIGRATPRERVRRSSPIPIPCLRR